MTGEVLPHSASYEKEYLLLQMPFVLTHKVVWVQLISFKQYGWLLNLLLSKWNEAHESKLCQHLYLSKEVVLNHSTKIWTGS